MRLTVTSVTLGGVIFANEFISKIPAIRDQLTEDTLRLISGNGAASSTGAVRNLPDEQRIPIQDAYAESLSVMWWYFFGASCVALLFSLLVGQHVLSTKLESVQPAKARRKSTKGGNTEKAERAVLDEKDKEKEVGNDVV